MFLRLLSLLNLRSLHEDELGRSYVEDNFSDIDRFNVCFTIYREPH